MVSYRRSCEESLLLNPNDAKLGSPTSASKEFSQGDSSQISHALPTTLQARNDVISWATLGLSRRATRAQDPSGGALRIWASLCVNAPPEGSVFHCRASPEPDVIAYASSQFLPDFTSAFSGTSIVYAPSISRFTSALTASSSFTGQSNTSSSCTCKVMRAS